MKNPLKKCVPIEVFERKPLWWKRRKPKLFPPVFPLDTYKRNTVTIKLETIYPISFILSSKG